MNILVAPDKFKETYDAISIAKEIQQHITHLYANHHVRLLPLADGGEGTAQILTFNSGGQLHTAEVFGPLFRCVNARYGISGDGTTAFVEMAEASGLQLIEPVRRNPLHTTSFGFGQLIKEALQHGVEQIIMGIGGSATNDAGIGMAAALGFRFSDAKGNGLLPVGRNLWKVATIENSNQTTDLKIIKIKVACDVNNPLYGKNGAAFIYAAQKGANAEEIAQLDRGLRHFAHVVKYSGRGDVAFQKGAGAAGGLGAGAMAFLNARLLPGIELVFEEINFEKHLKNTDLIITGEGKIDSQSLRGKVIGGVGRIAHKHNIPVIALCGRSELSGNDIENSGIQEVLPLFDTSVSLGYARKHSSKRIGQVLADCRFLQE